jgi:hypothetical protein
VLLEACDEVARCALGLLAHCKQQLLSEVAALTEGTSHRAQLWVAQTLAASLGELQERGLFERLAAVRGPRRAEGAMLWKDHALLAAAVRRDS